MPEPLTWILLLLIGVFFGRLRRRPAPDPAVTPHPDHYDKDISKIQREMKDDMSTLKGLSAQLLLSERRRVEAEAFTESIMEHLPVNVWVKDSGGRYLYGNKAVRDCFTDGRAESWVGHQDDEFLPSVNLADTKPVDMYVLETRETVRSVDSVPDRDGNERLWFIVRWHFETPDTPASVGGCAIDIAEILRAIHTLPSSRESISYQDSK